MSSQFLNPPPRLFSRVSRVGRKSEWHLVCPTPTHTRAALENVAVFPAKLRHDADSHFVGVGDKKNVREKKHYRLGFTSSVRLHVVLQVLRILAWWKDGGGG